MSTSVNAVRGSAHGRSKCRLPCAHPARWRAPAKGRRRIWRTSTTIRDLGTSNSQISVSKCAEGVTLQRYSASETTMSAAHTQDVRGAGTPCIPSHKHTVCGGAGEAVRTPCREGSAGMSALSIAESSIVWRVWSGLCARETPRCLCPRASQVPNTGHTSRHTGRLHAITTVL